MNNRTNNDFDNRNINQGGNDLGIRRVYSEEQKKRRKKNKIISNIMMTTASIFLIAAIILLAIDPIKNYRRQQIVDEALININEQIEINISANIENGIANGANGDASNEILPTVTIIVPRDANQINGEDTDFFGSDAERAQFMAEMNQQMAALPENVSLNCIGILNIESVDINEPIWDNDTVIDLRYGAGHHQTSVLPGQEGNCTILGHRTRREGVLFNALGEVEFGDIIEITLISGERIEYVVDEILVVEAEELPNLVDGDDGTGSQITLVTCTYTNEGKKRLIVIGHIPAPPEGNVG